MIPFNLVYYRPDTLAEAVEAWSRAERDGLTPSYLAGGTEITTFSRRGKMKPGALVDIKRIAECRVLGGEGEEAVFGAALTLNEVVESDSFPLLGRAAAIADHTVRNRLTLGGNIAGKLPYRETALPFLIAEASARLVGPGGERVAPVSDLFRKRLLLEPGELLVQLRVPKALTARPWFYRRRVRKTRLDYPLVTACFLAANGAIRMAVTGAFGFPLRSREAEEGLNDGAIPPGERPRRAVDAVPHGIHEDMRGTAAYRRMLLEDCVGGALKELAGVK